MKYVVVAVPLQNTQSSIGQSTRFVEPKRAWNGHAFETIAVSDPDLSSGCPAQRNSDN